MVRIIGKHRLFTAAKIKKKIELWKTHCLPHRAYASTFLFGRAGAAQGATLPSVAKSHQRPNAGKRYPLPPRCRAFRYNVFVVFSMRSNKSDKHSTFREPYHNNKAVMIPFDVKHIPIIADIIHIVEHFSDVTQVLPVSLTCNKVPVFQRLS